MAGEIATTETVVSVTTVDGVVALTTTESVVDVTTTNQGLQGATGPTGPTGSSGVVAVTSPITNSGTNTSANIGINQSALSIATTQLTGTVSNAQLANNSITVNNSAVALGGSVTTPMPFLPMRTGAFYRSPTSAINAALASPTANRLLALPIFITGSLTATAISVNTGATVTTSGVARIGIYNSNSNGEPNTLVLDAGTVSYSAANTTYAITISQPLSMGWYWLGVVVQSGTSTWQGTSNGASQGATLTQRAFNQNSSNAVISYYVDSVTAGLPSSPTWTASNSSAIFVTVGF